MPARKTPVPASPAAPAAPSAAGPAQPATQPAIKPVAKPAAKAPARAKARAAAPAADMSPRAAKAPKPAKPAKPAKMPKLRQKPVRDSFTMPEADFSLVATLKARALAAKRETRKSELLRAGLHALAAMDSAALLAALQALEPIKTGRPKKGH